ncbi:hypothetical protein HPB49_014720 [Dermacentor silvarum]|uniref:Uncharacterized protein n=1 Tax=Dermacentor silvarum TaxID=543639 RepID=A0ACB8D6B4_DERSI|nr:hypothetical protein HPB49_014720 [Dermacentor silvarum]
MHVERQTTEGRVRGTILRSLGKIVDEYRGIPFAEPPVGIFRFRPPQPKAPWEGTLDATAGTTACPQGSEKHSAWITHEISASREQWMTRVT